MAITSPPSRTGQRPGARTAPTNGWGPQQTPQQLRLAPIGRERKPALVVLGLVLVLACGAVVAALYLQVGGRQAVLAVARPVAAGHQISDQDLTSVRISFDPALRGSVLSTSLRDQVVGRIASVRLVPGTLLTRDELAIGTVPGPGLAVVGIALKPGQVPADGLRAGDTVMIVRTPPPNGAVAAQTGLQQAPKGPDVLVRSAQVFGARQTDSGDTIVVSVVVDANSAVEVTKAQATQQVSLVLLAAAGSGSGS